MAGGKSNYLNNKILNWIFNGAAYTPPATLYVALYTVAPTDATAGTEVSGGNYARVAQTADTSHFATTSTQTITNAQAIVFPTANASWGTVVAAGIMDLGTLGSGNLLYWGPLGSSVTVNSGNTFEFLAGGFVATEA